MEEVIKLRILKAHSMALHSAVSDITARIAERSRPTRSVYLEQLRAASTRAPSVDRMGCANLAHAVAGIPLDDRFKIVTQHAPNIGIVTAYNTCCRRMRRCKATRR
jgi:phosphogluconate dehydratase